MSRWAYVFFSFFVAIIVTVLNVEHISDQGGGRGWGNSSGHTSGGSWSSGGGGGGHK
jgi:hypothetical protein